jgi:glutamate/tyrosine decarboxylase-like PLP-dependent enzyme
VEDILTRTLAQAAERAMRGTAAADVDMAELRRQLTGVDFKRPRPLEEVIDWVSSGSPRALIEVEQHLIRAIASRAGMPEDSAGRFTVDAAEANGTALICALTRADAEFEDQGVRGFGAPVAVYASLEAHASWQDIAHRSGIGRLAVKPVATDGAGRMDMRALADAVRKDRRHGTVPVLICATAGTTAGIIDPLEPCATIARECNIWYHIDAAWSGAALCSKPRSDELAGVELADSVTLDTNNWVATTMGCGMLIARDAATLSEAFRADADAQWRHFLGLRLFLSLAVTGWRGCANV